MEKGFLVKKDTGGVFTWNVVDSQSTDQYISHVQYLGWPLTRRLSVSPEKLFSKTRQISEQSKLSGQLSSVNHTWIGIILTLLSLSTNRNFQDTLRMKTVYLKLLGVKSKLKRNLQALITFVCDNKWQSWVICAFP